MAEPDFDNVIVDECPPPPSYALTEFLEATSTLKEPPQLPINAMIARSQYNGCISAQLNRLEFDPSKDYRHVLTAKLKDVRDQSLSLISDIPSDIPVSHCIIALNDAIEEFHKLLGEYQKHEARERACDLLQSQLESLSELEKSMIRILEKYAYLDEGPVVDNNESDRSQL